MKNTNIRKFYYHLRHRYFTANNGVIVAAMLLAVSWAWGSVGMLQRNYTLQHEIDSKTQQLKLIQLKTQTLQYEQNYYKSSEYQELAARQRLGLVYPSEKVLILPPNSPGAAALDTAHAATPAAQPKPSNQEQWLNLLFGANRQGLQQ